MTSAPGLLLRAEGLGLMAAAIEVALIWLARVGFGRVAGYGLKYARGVRATHLWDGSAAAPATP